MELEVAGGSSIRPKIHLQCLTS